MVEIDGKVCLFACLLSCYLLLQAGRQVCMFVSVCVSESVFVFVCVCVWCMDQALVTIRSHHKHTQVSLVFGAPTPAHHTHTPHPTISEGTTGGEAVWEGLGSLQKKQAQAQGQGQGQGQAQGQAQGKERTLPCPITISLWFICHRSAVDTGSCLLADGTD
jgi:hypothetical protein